MGKISNIMNHYFSDSRRLADLFNTVLFHEDIVIPEELSDAAEVYHELETERQLSGTKNRRKERIRDVCKTLKTGEILRILALENMELVDYSAPFRCIQYDMMEYSRQLDILRKKNSIEDNLVTPAERICGLRRTDRLMPVYTICLYHGVEKWDGPRSLLDMPSIWAERDRYMIQNEDDREEYDMCLAVREWAEEERSIGRKEGHRQGAEDKAFLPLSKTCSAVVLPRRRLC